MVKAIVIPDKDNRYVSKVMFQLDDYDDSSESYFNLYTAHDCDDDETRYHEFSVDDNGFDYVEHDCSCDECDEDFLRVDVYGEFDKWYDILHQQLPVDCITEIMETNVYYKVLYRER